MSIKQRKRDHVEITADRDVSYRKSTGLDDYDFVHNATPELSLDDVSCSASFFNRQFSLPLFISSMTGGYDGAGSINAMIASVCEQRQIPFGVGSQRVMLENPKERETFEIVRKQAPSAFIAANIGGAQLTGGLSANDISILIETIQADAVIVHLNVLQELTQPEGDRNFKGVVEGIGHLVSDCDLPVIVKETGAGISGQVAEKLLTLGVHAIDVAGAGGTSWARVENLRNGREKEFGPFDNWGLPTATCIQQVTSLKNNYSFELIASGGIRTAFDIGKSLALGADMTAVAQPVIKALMTGGEAALHHLLDQLTDDLNKILLLLGCQTIDELNLNHLRKV